ncbi:MAG: iron-sulfur cluster assembly scaffold protein [Bryobacteraceae bacterium]
MHGPKLLDHFLSPRNVGELPLPAITVEAMNPACGDILRLSARVEAGRFVELRFKTRGCTASIAASSALTEILWGLSRVEAAAISPSDVENAVGGLPPESKHAATLCIEAVKALLMRVS